MRDNEGITIFKRVDSQCVWRSRTEMAHRESFFHFREADAAIFVLIIFIFHFILVVLIRRVKHHVFDILSACSEEAEAIDFELMWIGHEVDALALELSQLWENTRIKRLLWQKRITKVLLTWHDIDVNGLTQGIQE